MELNKDDIKASIKKYSVIGLVSILSLSTALSSFTTVDSGETVRIQNNLSGGYEWHQTEGVKFKVPFFSKVDVYNSVSTIAITDDQALIEASSATRAPLTVGFADNYTGTIEGSFRVKLSTSDEQLESMHQDVKGQKNLEGNTFLTFAKDMYNLTSDQFLAQDFMQGGKGAFKQRLADQSDNGMLVTERRKVRVEGQVADQGRGDNRSQAATTQQFSYRVVIKTDKEGKPLRRPHSLSKYGITVTQVDLGEFRPSPDLQSYVNTIKKRERERADIVAQQRTERDLAVTEQLRGDRERVTAKNKALMAKDQEVIQGNKKVELAEIQAKREKVERQKVADLAKIDKQRELDIAKANEGIQKANATAARYEAQAIKEKGFAEAAVEKAKLAAKNANKEIYMAELSLEETKALAEVLPQVKLDMPEVVMGAGSSSNGSLDPNLMNLNMLKGTITKQ